MAPQDDRLDELLSSSAPRTPLAENATRPALEQMAAAAAAAARPRPPRRLLAAGIALALGLGGAGVATAAASTLLEWQPWAEDPVLAYTYTLPSGAQCEERIGLLETEGEDPDLLTVADEVFRTTDVMSLVDVEATILVMRTEDHRFVNEDGTEEPAGYGTEHYSADHEYASAVSRAVNEVLVDELAARGFDRDDISLGYSGEAHCPGAEW